VAKLFSVRVSRLLPLALLALALAVVGPRIVQPGAAASAAASPGPTVYHDSLGGGWADWSWNSTINFGNSSPVYAGNRSLRLTVTRAWGAIQLHSDTGVAAAQFPYLTFAARASAAGQAYSVALTDTNNKQFTAFVPLTKYGGNPVTSGWTLYTIPVADLGAAGKQIGGFVLQESQGKAQPAVSGQWHQDGKFMGPVRSLNLWLSLSRRYKRTPEELPALLPRGQPAVGRSVKDVDREPTQRHRQ